MSINSGTHETTPVYDEVNPPAQGPASSIRSELVPHNNLQRLVGIMVKFL